MINFSKGEPTITDVVIKVKRSNGEVTEKTLKKGTNTYYVGDIIAAYKYNNEIYVIAPTFTVFFLTELVTDATEIAEIEARIPGTEQ